MMRTGLILFSSDLIGGRWFGEVIALISRVDLRKRAAVTQGYQCLSYLRTALRDLSCNW